MTFAERLARWTETRGPLAALACFRILVGFMVWRHLAIFIGDEFAKGFFRDRFHVPYHEAFLVPSQSVFLGILFAGIAGGVFMVLGLRTRVAIGVALASCSIQMAQNQLWYRHNRWFLILTLFLLLFTPCGRALSFDSRRKGASPIGTLWASALIRLQLTLIYLASAGSKALDDDWRSGRVLFDRARGEDGSLDPSTGEEVWQFLTAQALVSEFFLAICAWVPATRRFAMWWALVFHGFIEARYGVGVFSYLSAGVFVLAAGRGERNRVMLVNPRHALHRFLGWFAARMDWLNRIEVRESDVDDLQVRDADGRWYEGYMALAVAGASLVVTFAVAYPFTLLRHLGVGRMAAAPVAGASPSGPAPAELPVAPLACVLAVYLAYLLAAVKWQAFQVDSLPGKIFDMIVLLVLLHLLAGSATGRSSREAAAATP